MLKIMAGCPVEQCSESVQAATKIECFEADIKEMRRDIGQVFSRLDSNTKWLIGLFVTMNVETVALIVAVMQLVGGNAK